MANKELNLIHIIFQSSKTCVRVGRGTRQDRQLLREAEFDAIAGIGLAWQLSTGRPGLES